MYQYIPQKMTIYILLLRASTSRYIQDNALAILSHWNNAHSLDKCFVTLQGCASLVQGLSKDLVVQSLGNVGRGSRAPILDQPERVLQLQSRIKSVTASHLSSLRPRLTPSWVMLMQSCPGKSGSLPVTETDAETLPACLQQDLACH